MPSIFRIQDENLSHIDFVSDSSHAYVAFLIYSLHRSSSRARDLRGLSRRDIVETDLWHIQSRDAENHSSLETMG